MRIGTLAGVAKLGFIALLGQGVEAMAAKVMAGASSDFVGACIDLVLPYESHRLQAPDMKDSTSELQ